MITADSNLVAVRRVLATGCSRSRARTSRHAFTVLSYQSAGEIDVEHGGRFTLRRGDFHVIPAGHAHGVMGAREAEAWSVALPETFLGSERVAELAVPILRIAGGAVPRVAVPEERRAFVASLFSELASSRATLSLRNESLVTLLLSELAEHAPKTPAHVPSRGDLASRALAFVAANALSKISLEDVASALGANRTHVADVVRRATGASVGALVADLRLDEARRRLEETDELIEIIGERVGYADATHFARTFKRRFGCSPRAWRAAPGRAQTA